MNPQTFHRQPGVIYRRVTLYLPVTDIARIKALAASEGVSDQVVLQQLISPGLSELPKAQGTPADS